MRNIASFAAGLVFGLGLVVSGMTNPAKIIAFLDIAGDWDPSLALVMASALATTFLGYRLAWRREKPLYETQYHLPTTSAVDRPLLVGAGLFGVGWGLAGFCPGPAVSAAALGGAGPWAFLLAMAAGMLALRGFTHRRAVYTAAKTLMVRLRSH